MDWFLAHELNAFVATRDALEDPVTAFAAVAVPLYAAATLLLWLGGRRWRVACLSALASAAVALLANQVIAQLWERPRPYASHPGVHLLAARSGDPSFPSDHAAAAFAIAFAVYAVSVRAGAAFLVAAAAIAVSRVALGLHYPSDVLAGALVGFAAAQLVVHLGRPRLERLRWFAAGRA